MGSNAQYMLQLTTWTVTDTIKCAYTGWTAKGFADRYNQLFNVGKSDLGASAFAGGLILMAAIEKAQSLELVLRCYTPKG